MNQEFWSENRDLQSPEDLMNVLGEIGNGLEQWLLSQIALLEIESQTHWWIDRGLRDDFTCLHSQCAIVGIEKHEGEIFRVYAINVPRLTRSMMIKDRRGWIQKEANKPLIENVLIRW